MFFSFSGASTYAGGTTIRGGIIILHTITVDSYTKCNTINYFQDCQNLIVNNLLNLNGLDQKINHLCGKGQILLNGATLTVNSSSFTGEFTGPGCVLLTTEESLYRGLAEVDETPTDVEKLIIRTKEVLYTGLAM